MGVISVWLEYSRYHFCERGCDLRKLILKGRWKRSIQLRLPDKMGGKHNRFLRFHLLYLQNQRKTIPIRQTQNNMKIRAKETTHHFGVFCNMCLLLIPSSSLPQLEVGMSYRRRQARGRRVRKLDYQDAGRKCQRVTQHTAQSTESLIVQQVSTELTIDSQACNQCYT